MPAGSIRYTLPICSAMMSWEDRRYLLTPWAHRPLSVAIRLGAWSLVRTGAAYPSRLTTTSTAGYLQLQVLVIHNMGVIITAIIFVLGFTIGVLINIWTSRRIFWFVCFSFIPVVIQITLATFLATNRSTIYHVVGSILTLALSIPFVLLLAYWVSFLSSKEPFKSFYRVK